jgi:hypothetical protein
VSSFHIDPSSLRGDIVRRAITCRLDAGTDRPELRVIDQDLIAQVRERRRECVDEKSQVQALDRTQPGLPIVRDWEPSFAACARLRKLLRHYPWVSDVDRAVALSLLLTAIARPVLPAAPLHGTDSPEAGSGKSLLIDTHRPHSTLILLSASRDG